MAVIHKELRRGGEIADRVMMGKAKWKDLFEKHTFFTSSYKYYLCIITASTSSEAQSKWAGFVESKVRLLVGKLTDQTSISIAQPFNKGYNRAHRCLTDQQVEEVKTGSLEYYAKDIGTATTGHGLAVGALIKDETANGDESTNGDEKLTMVYTTTHYIGLDLYEGQWILQTFCSTMTPCGDPRE